MSIVWFAKACQGLLLKIELVHKVGKLFFWILKNNVKFSLCLSLIYRRSVGNRRGSYITLEMKISYFIAVHFDSFD
jgi:hypothetical protein